MAFENATDTTTAKPAKSPDDVAAATPAVGQGYDAQKAALKPAPAEPPKFDQWKLTPEVQALFVSLAKTEDAKVIEATMNALVKTHGVPKSTVEGVIAANKGFFARTAGAIKAGSWHTVSTDEQGNITLEFKADGKGIGWDAATWSLQGDIKDKSITYTDKDDGWKAKGGYDDRGYVTVTTGKDPKDASTYHVEGGKDGGGAAYTRTQGDKTTTATGDFTTKDGQNTVSAGYGTTEGEDKSRKVGAKGFWGTRTGAEATYDQKDGDKGLSANAGFVREGDTNTATAGVTRTDGKKSTAVNGTFTNSPTGNTATAGVTRTDGDKSTAVTGSFANSPTQNTATAGVTRKDGDKSTTVDGSVLVGDQSGGRLHVNRTDGKNSTDVKGGVVVTEGQTTADAAVVRKTKDGSTSVSGTGWVGDKTGGQVAVGVDNKERKVDVSADASRTVADNGGTVTQAGGSVAVTRKAELDENGKPKEGAQDVTVRVTARGKKTTETNGDQATNLTFGGGYTAGNTSADAAYTTEGGTKGGTSYRFHDITTNFGRSWDLDKKAKEGLKLNLGGHLRLSDVQGEDVVATGDLTGSWFKGEGDNKQDFTFRLMGGQDQLSNVSGLAHQTPDMLGGDKGYARFGHIAGTYTAGTRSYTGDATFGATDQTQFGGVHLGAAEKDKWKLDATAAYAQQDGKTAALFKATGDFALSQKLKLDVGGSYTALPGTPEHQKLWDIHAGLGYDLKKDQHLTLRMGVAGDGSQLWYVPEVMYQMDGKFSASAMGVIGRNDTNTFGAKLTHDKSGVSVFGGYGDPTALSNPYAGNSGMSMPSMGGNDVMGRGAAPGAFIGVQWNALPTIKKAFGWK